MAPVEGSAQTLKCNKWVLKVPIHCLGCKREIKKVLHSIEGVYTTSIDPQQQKVTVTGSIDSEILLKKLSKTGKHAEICSEKSGEKCKKNEKPSDPKPCKNEKQTTAISDDTQKQPSKPETKSQIKNTEEKTPDKKGSEEQGSPEECRKTKKGKVQKGNSGGDEKVAPGKTGLVKVDQVNLNAAIESHEGSSATTVQVSSYNAAYPTKVDYGVSYQVPLAPAYISHSNQVEGTGTGFGSFDIFSDENANGCSVM